MQVERREQPYLTDEMKKRLAEVIVPRYETKLGALMPVLREIQHAYGHIPYQAQEEVAEFLDLNPADVLDTVSFYEEFHLEPTGKYIVGVCQSIAGEMCGCGHRALVDHIRSKYGIEPHETTEDGKFTLMTLECLGSCDTAPVALVGETLHEGLTVEDLDRILEELE